MLVVDDSVVEEFLRTNFVPEDEIPKLVAECGPGSMSPAWTEVLNRWRMQHNLPVVVNKYTKS